MLGLLLGTGTTAIASCSASPAGDGGTSAPGPGIPGPAAAESGAQGDTGSPGVGPGEDPGAAAGVEPGGSASAPPSRVTAPSPEPLLTPEEVSRALGRTTLDGVVLQALDARGQESWREPGDVDLPTDVVEPDFCGALVWMPQTLGALRDGLLMEVWTLPLGNDPSRADIKGVIAVTTPSAGDAAGRMVHLEELAGRCATYTVAVGGSSPTHLTTSGVRIAHTDGALDLRESRRAETVEQEVEVVARVGNVLLSVERPADDATRAHRLVAAIAEQLRAGN